MASARNLFHVVGRFANNLKPWKATDLGARLTCRSLFRSRNSNWTNSESFYSILMRSVVEIHESDRRFRRWNLRFARCVPNSALFTQFSKSRLHVERIREEKSISSLNYYDFNKAQPFSMFVITTAAAADFVFLFRFLSRWILLLEIFACRRRRLQHERGGKERENCE